MKITCKTTLLSADGETRITLEIPESDLDWKLGQTMLAEGRGRGTLDWGDGQIQKLGTEESIFHNYAAPGRYEVRISDDFAALGLSANNLAYASRYAKRIVAFETDAKRLTTLQDNAFRTCTNLTDFDCRNGAVRSLGFGAFFNCPSIERIDLPHIRELSPDTANLPFVRCTALAEVHFAKANEAAIRASAAFLADPRLGAPSAEVVFDL